MVAWHLVYRLAYLLLVVTGYIGLCAHVLACYADSKSFIRYGSNACWIHTITIKYEYKLDSKI